MKISYFYFSFFLIAVLFTTHILYAQTAEITSYKDNTIYEITNPSDTLSNGSGQYFFVGVSNCCQGEPARRGLIAFDITSNVPAAATINSVVLTLHMARTHPENGARSIAIHRVLSDWGEGASIGQGEGGEGAGADSEPGDANWVHTFYPDTFWNNAGGDFVADPSAAQIVNTQAFYTWGSTPEMVADVRHWLDNGQNFGWIIIGREDTLRTAKAFDSHENLEGDFLPKLTVEYNTPPQIQPLDDVTFDEDDSVLVEFSELYEYVSDNETPDSLLVVNLFGGDFIDVTPGESAIVLTAQENWFGNESLLIQVSDGQFTAETQLAIHVLPVNDIPYFDGLPDTVRLDSTQTIPLWQYIGDIETPDSLLAVDLIGNDSLQVMYNPLNGHLTLDRNLLYFDESTLTISIMDDSNAVAIDSILVIIDAVNSIKEDVANIPHNFQLMQNYPNPFNPATMLRFALPKTEHVKLAIYNALGQKILTVVDELTSAGIHEVEFKAQHLASGIYFYRINAGEFMDMKKMVLLK